MSLKSPRRHVRFNESERKRDEKCARRRILCKGRVLCKEGEEKGTRGSRNEGSKSAATFDRRRDMLGQEKIVHKRIDAN